MFLFQALERELAPVEEKLTRLNKMAQQVTEAYPQNSSNVQSQLANISAMWKRLKEKAANRKYQLEEAYMLQSFMSDSRDLVIELQLLKLCKYICNSINFIHSCHGQERPRHYSVLMSLVKMWHLLKR